MAVTRLELHYFLRDDAHSMNALLRNKCEAEALAAFTHIAQQLGVSVELESTAFREGGLREIWTFLGSSNSQLTLLLAVIVLVFSRIPVSDAEMDALNKEVLKLTIEEKKLNIQKLKREIGKGEISEGAADDVSRYLDGDVKVATRRSNFYRQLLTNDRVTALSLGEIPEGEVKPVVEHRVERAAFPLFVQLTDKLAVEVVENAQIEIVAPVLKEGSYHWKGVYLDQPISFAMGDDVFKSDVLMGKISFQHGALIECVLNIHRKLDEVGDAHITGYTVSTVLSKADRGIAQETAQGKRHRFVKKQAASQGKLFEPPK
ncbi:hypothetical protein MCEZEM1_02962 [Comamonadaceae bacterium]|jgi:hypothetical protein